MIDFGLSKHFKYGEILHEAVGTPYTVAPEVIRGSYDERCDLWAIGVISFLLLSGEPPFGGCGGPEPLMTVRGNILKGSFFFEPEDIWATVSPTAREFIKTLLVTDPSQRPTAQTAQKHKWLREWAKRGRTQQDTLLNPNVVKALVNFKEFSDMRKLLCEVLSFTLLPDQIRDLRREFEKMDTDGSGEISLSALKQVLMTNAVAGSLGALTEDEVTDIFDAMRVRKTETRIHWHEFIAAGLSQCSVDDRNLRLAFERLDSDHKGVSWLSFCFCLILFGVASSFLPSWSCQYITLDDIMDLMGSDAIQSEEAMRQMWGDSMKAVKSQNARITYDDFLLLMKGQTREHPRSRSTSPIHPAMLPIVAAVDLESSLSSLVQSKLLAVPEGETADSPPKVSIVLPEPAKITPPVLRQASTPKSSRHDKSEPVDSPLSMDDDDDLYQSAGPGVPGSLASLTPPTSPVRGITDYVTPCSGRKTIEFMPTDNDPDLQLPGFGGSDPYNGRWRSQSMDEKDKFKDDSEVKTDEDLHAVADAMRDMLLPETDHTHPSHDLEDVVKDKSKSALVVNRKLYRAHRQMRLAVMEASKRFEEQQVQHAEDVLMARQQKEGGVVTAGLVMRHGHTKQVSSDAIRKLLSENKEQQQQLVAMATRRGGRGKRSRKKTISDMSGMLSSIGQEELGAIAVEASAVPPILVTAASSPVVLPEKKLETDGPPLAATVPGKFRKTTDPFSLVGKYGAVTANLHP